jgi:hypothetical protein
MSISTIMVCPPISTGIRTSCSINIRRRYG